VGTRVTPDAGEARDDGREAVEGVPETRRLAGVNGFDVLKRMREHAVLRDTPVLMLTSIADGRIGDPK
jgi:hypothetical protein